MDATAQAQLIARGELSPAELVDAAIERIERLNPALGAVIHPAFEEARAAARSPALPAGPLRGVPILMKDIGGPEAGRPNGAGMRLLRDAGFREKQDGYFTAKLRAAGAISLGRTNLCELALLPTTEPAAFPPTHNPYDLRYSPGGSSGGSAAAVASRMVALAHASDGGGSIRGPASMCGLVGLKPSRGRISFGPELGERWSGLSSEFVLCRSVRDSALLLDLLEGAMPGDPYFAPPPTRSYLTALGKALPRLRIAFVGRVRDVVADPECLRVLADTARALLEVGHNVEEGTPAALAEPEHVLHYLTIVACHTARGVELAGVKAGKTPTADDVEPLTWALCELGKSRTAVQLLDTLNYVHAFGRRLAAYFADGVDVLLTPTLGALPPELGFIRSTPEEPLRALTRSAPYGAFTLPWNMAGFPAISLPLGVSTGGLPIGMQLVAAYGREDLLLQLAAELEQVAPWKDRRPEISV
jgi:amidase